MEGPDDCRVCGTGAVPVAESVASFARLVGRPSPGGSLRHACLARRRPPLPRFSSFWSLLIYVSLSSAGTSPILRLLALVWWFLLCLAPINTGIMGYADLLGPLVIIAAILACMHLADKRNA